MNKSHLKQIKDKLKEGSQITNPDRDYNNIAICCTTYIVINTKTDPKNLSRTLLTPIRLNISYRVASVPSGSKHFWHCMIIDEWSVQRCLQFDKHQCTKIIDGNVPIFGSTMMLTSMPNLLILHSVSLSNNDANLGNLTEYSSMFEVVLVTIWTKNSPSF